jgi:hypothetical protein
LVPLPVSEHDATPSEVVGGDFDLDAISRKDPDAMHAHFSGRVGENVVPVLQLYLEYGVG